MWEQIALNKRRTSFLVAGMAALLLGLGFVIGESAQPGAGVIGLLVCFVIWLVMTLVAYFQGDSILLAVNGAKKIEKSDHPQLFNVVEEMTIASGRPKMPDVYIMNDSALNAFAVGRDPNKSAVAITAGLLGALDRDELQGVIAHEMAHIKNRDVVLMTMVGIMLGAIVMVSEIYLRSLWYSGGSSRRYGRSSGGRGGGQGQVIVAVLAVVLAILAPFLAQLIYFAISRKREYLADASGAVFTRYPEGLASALEKLGASPAKFARANKATAPMFIVNPFKQASLSALTSTHPPLEERIRILRSMGGGVSYGAYQAAWSAVDGKRAGRLPKSALRDETQSAVRVASADSGQTARERARIAGDALRKANEFLFLPCSCGLRLKLPPEFKHDQVECPRCHRSLALPIAQMATAQEILDHVATSSASKTSSKGSALTVARQGAGWMSFKCACGATKSISPEFSASRVQCEECGRTIHVK